MKANQIDDREVSPMPFIPNQTSPGAPVAQAPAGAGLMPPGRKERYCLRAFLYGLGISLIFPALYHFDNGYFYSTAILMFSRCRFTRCANDAVRSGNIGWSWTTDLGANFIGSYSFYLLGAVFWLTLPFPAKRFLPDGPAAHAEIRLASMTGYLTCGATSNAGFAVIGGMLYAFSGFPCTISFNHFHEAIVFPAHALGLDEFI
ncbi:MAG: YfhO family protein [Hydrogeniiclostridium mannosilyticum]